MRTGYPRFFVPRVVDKLAEKVIGVYGGESNRTTVPSDKVSAIIFPTHRYAEIYLKFLARQVSPEELHNFHGITLTWKGYFSLLDARDGKERPLICPDDSADSPYRKDISAVIYPTSLYPLAKAIWQHTGFGISSRRATYWLENSPLCGNLESKSTKDHSATRIEPDPEPTKEVIRERIADGQSLSDLKVDKENVLLYPTGMAAITETAAAIKKLCPTNKRPPTAAVFG